MCVAVRLEASKSSSGGASASDDGALRAGLLIEYDKGGRGVLALVHSPDGKKNFWVVDQSGRRSSIQPKQVTLVLPGPGAGGGAASYTAADLQAFGGLAANLDLSLLEIAWEIAADGGVPLSLRDMASLLFDDTGARSIYTTHCMLQADEVYFKAAKAPGTYEARPPESVAAAKRQIEERERLKQEADAWRAAVAAARGAKTRAQQPSAEAWKAGQFGPRIAALRAVAINAGGGRVDDASLSLAAASLALLGTAKADAEAATQLLTELGVWRVHEPLELLRRGLPLEYPREPVEAAKAVLASPPPDLDASGRVDLTHLPVYTIDDASTTEVDDGLSVELLPGRGGVRLWVHVADPTRYLQPHATLDVAGRERGRTLYFPWGMLPMFPEELAAGPFSLRAGQVCDAMSVGVVLGPGGEITQPKVVPTRVRVSHKLTYEQADRAIAAGGAGGADGADTCPPHPDLVLLRGAADARQRYRTAKGCIEIPLPEAKVHVPASHLDRSRPGVTITRISQWESASRQMVAEMMILAGEVVGSVGASASLPLPYRGQEAPQLPPARQLEALPEGACRGYALKRCMTRSTVTATPQRHASLALDAYVQFTSPIRRYSDIIAHFQIKAWLRGDPLPFSPAQIEKILEAGAERGRELGQAEREAENYWVCEYLRQNYGAEHPATVLGWFREESKLAAVLLDDLGLEAIIKVDGRARPGDRCVLAASEVNAATGLYRFYVAGWSYMAADQDGEGDGDGEELEEEEGEVVLAEEEEEEEEGEEGEGGGQGVVSGEGAAQQQQQQQRGSGAVAVPA